MPIYLTSPTAPPGSIMRLTPCEGWVVHERLDGGRTLERRADGTERILDYIYVATIARTP